MYGSLEELCQAQYVPVPPQAGASKPCGQAPDWVATMPWVPVKASASAAIWAWVAPGGGVVLSWNVPASTDLVKIGAPELSPYCDKIVDQLSFVWPGCRAPRPP